jgi:hypothetical protein
MTQPNILSAGTSNQSINTAGKKAVITQRSALISTIRTWFLYRDEAVWAFVGGTEFDKPLEEIVMAGETMAHIADANQAAKRAWAIAEKIARESEQKASSVMRDAINELLANEAPVFLLSVPHIPGSF